MASPVLIGPGRRQWNAPFDSSESLLALAVPTAQVITKLHGFNSSERNDYIIWGYRMEPVISRDEIAQFKDTRGPRFHKDL